MFKQFFINIKESSKVRKRYALWVLLLASLNFIVFSDHGVLKRIKLESQKKELSQKIELEYKYKDSLNKVIKKLQNDTLEIERIAREKYGMVKPGEEVFIIKQKTGN